MRCIDLANLTPNELQSIKDYIVSLQNPRNHSGNED